MLERIMINLGWTGWFVLSVKVVGTLVVWSTGEAVILFR